MKKVLFSTLGMVLSLCLALTMTAVVNPGPGIVGLWHFDEIFTDGIGVQTTPDSSGQYNTGTLMPPGLEPPLAPGMFNTALSFNGTDQWVDCGATVDDSITTELTLEAWIKDDGNIGNNFFIISNDLTYTTKKGYDFFLWYDGRLYADVGTGVLGRVSYLMPGDTLWHYVAVTWDGSTVTLYFDGDPVGIAPHTGSYSDPDKNTYVGKINWPPNYYPYPNGMLDEVRIYNYALSEEMIENHANGYYEYSIDIKPDSDPNSINLGEQGKLTVAILGSLDLDVTQIDPATIMLGDAGLATRGKTQKYAYSYEDVNEDGYTDLVAHFNVQDLGLNETTTSLTLLANLWSGFGITGTDSVRVVPPQ